MLTFDDLLGRKTVGTVHLDFTRSESAWVYELEGLPRLRVWHHRFKGRMEREFYIDDRRVKDVHAAVAVLNGQKSLERAVQEVKEAEQKIPEHAQRPGKVSIEAQIEEIDYELAQRAKVYPRIGASEPRRKGELDLHVERMKAIRATLVWLRDNEASIKQRASY